MRLVQLSLGGADRRVGVVEAGGVLDLTSSLPHVQTVQDLLTQFDESQIAPYVETAGISTEPQWSYEALLRGEIDGVSLECPVDAPEVWGAGLTYEVSRDAREEESEGWSAHYTAVYRGARPELFMKTSGMRRVAPPNGKLGVRSDSKWTVPEPELAVVIGKNRRIAGYTVANDVTARDIEAENPLYLPQAKIFTNSCSFGPDLYLPSNTDAFHSWSLTMCIKEADATVYEDTVQLGKMSRSISELVDYLCRDNDVPVGTVLMTGTGLVPPDTLSLVAGQTVSIQLEPVGLLLSHDVVQLDGTGSSEL